MSASDAGNYQWRRLPAAEAVTALKQALTRVPLQGRTADAICVDLENELDEMGIGLVERMWQQ